MHVELLHEYFRQHDEISPESRMEKELLNRVHLANFKSALESRPNFHFSTVICERSMIAEIPIYNRCSKP